MTEPMGDSEVGQRCDAIVAEISKAVIGKEHAVRLVLATALAHGHVLLEDLPGLGKTLLVSSLARVTGMDGRRIQFTPDLMPMDVTGSVVLDPVSRQPQFRHGPVFANILLADEINRAPAKTQAALLEAMQERQVTVDGTTHRLERPFIVVATQNPIEFEGTYPLPEAQLDRFLARVEVGYPDADDEWQILSTRVARGRDEVDLSRVVNRSEFLAMQAVVEQVHLDEAVGRYIVEIVLGTRAHRRVRVGASPRGSLAVMKLARAWALMSGRTFVTPDDIQEVAVEALAHRLVLRPEAWAQGIDERDVVNDVLGLVPTPVVDR